MPAIHETAYPRIKPNLSPKELKELFTPTEEELFLLDSKTKKTLTATCKSEKFNQFIGWISFGGGGVISDNMRANQKK